MGDLDTFNFREEECRRKKLNPKVGEFYKMEYMKENKSQSWWIKIDMVTNQGFVGSNYLKSDGKMSTRATNEGFVFSPTGLCFYDYLQREEFDDALFFSLVYPYEKLTDNQEIDGKLKDEPIKNELWELN